MQKNICNLASKAGVKIKTNFISIPQMYKNNFKSKSNFAIFNYLILRKKFVYLLIPLNYFFKQKMNKIQFLAVYQ